MISADLYSIGVNAAKGLQGRSGGWYARGQRAKTRVRLLDRRFAEAGYPRGWTVPEEWLEAFLPDGEAVAFWLSDAALRLHVDAGRGGRFVRELARRETSLPYRLLNGLLRLAIWAPS